MYIYIYIYIYIYDDVTTAQFEIRKLDASAA